MSSVPVLHPVLTNSHSSFRARVCNSCLVGSISCPAREEASAHLHLACNSRKQLQKGQLEEGSSRAACGRPGMGREYVTTFTSHRNNDFCCK